MTSLPIIGILRLRVSGNKIYVRLDFGLQSRQEIVRGDAHQGRRRNSWTLVIYHVVALRLDSNFCLKVNNDVQINQYRCSGTTERRRKQDIMKSRPRLPCLSINEFNCEAHTIFLAYCTTTKERKAKDMQYIPRLQYF